MRARVGDDFWLMSTAGWRSTSTYATRLAAARRSEYGLKWIEEALSPDDYWGYAELKRRVPPGMLVTTGEHEATRWGFRMLLEMDCCDIIQPDVGWCGGVTELIKIADLADAHGKLVVPHGSSVYSYHFVITRHNSPFAEFLMMAPKADEVVPMFAPQLLGEPVPENGRLKRLGARQARLRRRAEPRYCRSTAPTRIEEATHETAADTDRAERRSPACSMPTAASATCPA